MVWGPLTVLELDLICQCAGPALLKNGLAHVAFLSDTAGKTNRLSCQKGINTNRLPRELESDKNKKEDKHEHQI